MSEELLVSETITGEGQYPTQVVLRLVKPDTWATHIKVHPPDQDAYFILGNYFFERHQAESDFHKRVAELGN